MSNCFFSKRGDFMSQIEEGSIQPWRVEAERTYAELALVPCAFPVLKYYLPKKKKIWQAIAPARE